MPEQFENGVEFDGKKSLQDFDTKEMYLHPKNQSVSFKKFLKMFCFHYFEVFTRCHFQGVPARVPFSKSTVFKIYRQKMCHFCVNGRPIRHIFHRFQNVPASCERSLKIWSRCWHPPPLCPVIHFVFESWKFSDGCLFHYSARKLLPKS